MSGLSSSAADGDEPHSTGWPRLEAALTKRLTATGAYGVAVAVEKGGALIVVPLLAAFLTPAQYGGYDVVISFLELFLILASAGLAPQLIRFAQTATSEAEQRKCAGEILGVGLVIGAIWAAFAILFAETAIETLGLSVSVLAFQFIFVAGAFDIFIALPAVWFRLKDRAALFLIVVTFRTIAQVAGVTYALYSDLGVDGVLIMSGTVHLSFGAIYFGLTYREVGIGFSKSRAIQTLHYGLPFVGAAVSTYLMINASRLFLNGSVPDEEIGYFGLAMRLALAIFILLYPIEMWWAPKRIAALQEPDGLERSARIWGLQMAILIYGAVGMSLCAPLFALYVLPPEYMPMVDLVPLACLAIGLHQMNVFSNVGSVKRDTGYQVLAVDGGGAALTVLGYFLLIPVLGVYGALVAMMVGHAARLAAYLILGRKTAPIPFPFAPALIAFLIGVAAVLVAPGAGAPGLHFFWSAVVAVGAPIAFVAVKLVALPPALENRLRSVVASVR